MNGRSRRSIACLLAATLLYSGAAQAGGPLTVRSNGAPYAWSTTADIVYRTDNGPLSGTVNEAAVRARVAGMFAVWQNVATASIRYARATTSAGNGAGFIGTTGAFSGGDVNTIAEYDAVDADCEDGNQSPVIYDVNGSIISALGLDETSVIGFAGPCALTGSQIVSGQVVMNGLFQDGVNGVDEVEDIPAAGFDAAIVHEVGHFSGLDHSQVNINCLTSPPCSNDDLEGLPTMFPFLLSATQGSLSPDDIAWISRLHPETAGGSTFTGTHGTITGTVFFSDGQTHAQYVNVVARRIDSGANEDRRIAVSVISGYKFTGELGNPILNTQGSPFGTIDAADVGLFEIPVPAGSYTVELESLHPEFVEGSSIGDFPIAMPGSAPPPTGVVVVAAGATVSVGNLVLIGTDPRFDLFEGP